MTSKEIQQQVELAIKQSLQGQEIENPKVDCKRKWYQFSDPPQLYSFLKDCTSIANTVVLDGFIIIGYDDRDRNFYGSKFSDCGLRDTSDPTNILIKHVDAPCDIAIYPVKVDSNTLNVIHIPPSLHKPHVIREFKYFKNGAEARIENHRVFVRKNTTIREASKYDLDLMYYDRKNVIPEYEINIWLNVSHLKLWPQCNQGNCVSVEGLIPITIENSGRRSVSTNLFTMTISIFEDPSPDETIQVRSVPGIIGGETHITGPRLVGGENYILRPQDIKHFNLRIESSSFNRHNCSEVETWLKQFHTNRRNLLIKHCVLHSTQQKALVPKVTLTY